MGKKTGHLSIYVQFTASILPYCVCKEYIVNTMEGRADKVQTVQRAKKRLGRSLTV